MNDWERSRTLLYIPQGIARDSAFPFESGERVIVTIDRMNKRLVVEPVTDEYIVKGSRVERR